MSEEPTQAPERKNRGGRPPKRIASLLKFRTHIEGLLETATGNNVDSVVRALDRIDDLLRKAGYLEKRSTADLDLLRREITTIAIDMAQNPERYATRPLADETPDALLDLREQDLIRRERECGEREEELKRLRVEVARLREKTGEKGPVEQAPAEGSKPTPLLPPPPPGPPLDLAVLHLTRRIHGGN